MKKPKYKIGDTVITKGWLVYNLFEVVGGYFNEDLQEWQYVLSIRNRGLFDVKHCRGEGHGRYGR